MNTDERKIEEMSADDLKLAQMLAGLKRVDAPANFEFGLKAKIANAVPPKTTTIRFPSFVRYAVPTALIAAVSTFYLLSPSDPTNTAAVQSSGVAPPVAASEVAAAPVLSSEQLPAATAPPVRPTIVAGARPRAASPSAAKPNVREAGGQDRSKVSAVTQPKIFTQPGVGPIMLTPTAPVTPVDKVSLTAKEIFPLLGIDAGFEDGWKVKAVRVNSLADRAGLKQGDVLEAIDDNQFVKDAKFKSGLDGKVMKVRRDGKIVELNLQNK